MANTERASLDNGTLLSVQRQYHTQKRLAEALFGLFRTLGSTLRVDRVANIGLLTLTGQLLIKCAAYFHRDKNVYKLLSTVGARDPHLQGVEIAGGELGALFPNGGILELDRENSSHPALRSLHESGFRTLFPLLDDSEPLGFIALGEKIVPGALTMEDQQILDAFSVVISVSLKTSAAYEVMEASRNELQRLNELKREFLRHVSHEFRTPLTILKSTIEMGEVDPEIHEMQRSALARFEHLVSSVLLLNEVNANGIKLDFQRLTTRHFIDTRLKSMIQKHGTFALVSDLPDCTFEVDVFKFQTAIESLLDNAVKFGADTLSGEVAVYLSTRALVLERRNRAGQRTRQLALGELKPETPPDRRSPDTYLVVEVKDMGIGIPVEDVNVIFQPFTQAINSPTRGVKGAGLGLTMAWHIVDAHGGELFCRSTLERGTVFYIAIPFRYTDEAPDPALA